MNGVLEYRRIGVLGRTWGWMAAGSPAAILDVWRFWSWRMRRFMVFAPAEHLPSGVSGHSSPCDSKEWEFFGSQLRSISLIHPFTSSLVASIADY